MSKNCLNCDYELLSEAKHCSNCGQKVAIQNLSFWSIVSDFFSNLFNIEAKIWRTFRDIWKPAKLTIAFISGKRVMYYNPIRIFIIALFTFFALYLFNIKDTFRTIDNTVKSKEQEVWQKELAENYDSLSLKYNWPEEINEKVKNELLSPQPIDEERITITPVGDSIYHDESSTVDSLNKKTDKNNVSNKTNAEFAFASKDSLVAFDLGEGKISGDITIDDLFRLSEEELEEKIIDKTWMKKTVILQIQKVIVNFSSMLQFFIGNGTWLTIALILLISAFYKLLYWRHSYLYAEHFIFHVYGHTRLLLLAIFGLLIEIFIYDSNAWLTPWFIVGMVYLFLGMKKFYNQSIIKTTFKFTLTLFIYMWLVLLCLTIVFGLSFFFF